MIKHPAEARFTAQQAYCHEWIQSKKFNTLQPEIARDLLTNLRNFHATLFPNAFRPNKNSSKPHSCIS
jgi:hypothetical protein